METEGIVGGIYQTQGNPWNILPPYILNGTTRAFIEGFGVPRMLSSGAEFCAS